MTKHGSGVNEDSQTDGITCRETNRMKLWNIKIGERPQRERERGGGGREGEREREIPRATALVPSSCTMNQWLRVTYMYESQVSASDKLYV